MYNYSIFLTITGQISQPLVGVRFSIFERMEPGLDNSYPPDRKFIKNDKGHTISEIKDISAIMGDIWML